jgi:hypothetical protein
MPSRFAFCFLHFAFYLVLVRAAKRPDRQTQESVKGKTGPAAAA